MLENDEKGSLYIFAQFNSLRVMNSTLLFVPRRFRRRGAAPAAGRLAGWSLFLTICSSVPEVSRDETAGGKGGNEPTETCQMYRTPEANKLVRKIKQQ